MASVNKVILVGNLGADPVLKDAGAAKVANLSIATTWKSKSGESTTEWHRVTAWNKDAENCAKFLRKGSSVYIEGRLQTRTYEKNGEKRYSTDIMAERVVFLGGGKGDGAKAAPKEREPGADDVGDDEVPF